ncbi:ATP-binding cassette domain-containing protein [Nocardia sp. IBHARD005]|uniref:ATP-binding cassette domain-containing protein n=1 Tax=Nocardia sp. IBHARD005 TaxID=3457765 RepID=UPI0040593A26
MTAGQRLRGFSDRSDAIATVGLASAADSKVTAYSLGMVQRLGVVTALFGDPEILMLDEPVHGLDTEGIRWLRTWRSLLDSVQRKRTMMNRSSLNIDSSKILELRDLVKAAAQVGAGSMSLSAALTTCYSANR